MASPTQPQNPNDLLRIRLNHLARCTAPGFRVTCPEGDSIRMRKLVHRGAQRPVSKYPSFKLERIVECESLLEVDMAILLDACPNVEGFAEQPLTLHYLAENTWRWHIPDFAMIYLGRLHFIEVKFQRDIDAEIEARTEHLKQRLTALGASYALLTEAEIRAQHWLDNARKLLRRGRHSLSELELLGYHETLRRAGASPLSNWGWVDPGNRAAIAIAHLILRGKAGVPLSQPLSPESVVEAYNTEVTPWPSALFA